ncbi:MAG: metal ABC transporter permease [Clostridia bacterium]|nr:metal ABC transporter permease [Clostridia bacterium]MBQ7316534.1 metal ABC transporter permease [Clostridia bacterium]
MALSLGWLDTLKLYLSYPFVRYALIAGVLISLCAGLLGVTLVLKRYSMIGDGLSHVAFGAMAIAAVTGLAPMTVALPVTVAAAVLLLLANERGLIKGDAAIAMLSAGALAVGYLLLNLFPSTGTGSLSGDVCSSLFGSTSMMTLSPSDVWLCVILCAVVLGFFILCYHRIFAVTFDQTFATATGLSSRVYNFAIAAVSGVVIVMAMKLVGALLISALIIFPALSSMRLFKSFRSVMVVTAILAVAGSLSGLILSLLFSTPTGATVVVVHIVIFGIFSILKMILKR